MRTTGILIPTRNNYTKGKVMAIENLLAETIEAIKESGHTPRDIKFIGSEKTGHSCTWDQFVVLADKDYELRTGGQSVAHDLIIVFADGSKVWREYLEGEQWVYSKPVRLVATRKEIKQLFTVRADYQSLSEIN